MSNTPNLTPVEQKRLRELEEAFELFNETSRQLTEAYEALQRQLEAVQARLAHSEHQRLQAVERLERLLELLPAGVVVLDEAGHIQEMNPSAEQILGKEALARPWEIVERNVFLHRNAAGELVTHDGRFYQTSEAALDGQGTILLIQDVTDARQLQLHTSRHQRLNSMGEMAASLAHQIRTPLSTATLYVSQLGRSIPPERQADFAAKALVSLRHIESLINDMLQYARGGKAKEMPVSVNGLLRRLEQAMQPRVQQRQAVLQVIPLEGDVTLMGDEDALLSALQNLVNNALEITEERPLIEVQAEVVNNQLIIRVIDNGPGIDEEIREKIFEPFYTRRAQGTGLGLAVVRAVVEAHGGEVVVHSLPGVGSTFTLILPLVRREEL